ncbi:MAG: hypothetical protein FWD31_09160 [Planctomycetaceae bacterium]|nr:hypothetical protein [Planctomycetaceae bacterium]
MSGLPNENYSNLIKATDSASGRMPAVHGTSMNELIDRAFREPYYRFLLFLAALWRNWYWVIPFSFILGGLLGGLTYYTTKEQYSSQAWVRIYMEQPFIAFPQRYGREEAMAIVLASLQIIKSPDVLNDALDRIKDGAKTDGIDISSILKKRDPQMWLANHINIHQQGGSPYYIISFTTEDPQLSQLILTSIIASHSTQIEEDHKVRNSGVIESLREIATTKKSEIDGLNREYDRLAQEIAKKGGDLPSELSRLIVGSAQNPLSVSIASLEAEIAAEKIMIQLNRNVLEDETEIPDSEVEGDLYQYPTMAQLLKEKVDLHISLKERMQRPGASETRQVRNIQ